MSDATNVVIGVYTPDDDAEAIALEAACVQGASFRMSFRRSTFRRRAENFDEWRIATARIDGRLVGVAAVAIKDALLRGVPTRAAFYFDSRVAPDVRGRGIGRMLGEDVWAWGSARSGFGYAYTLADNRAAARLAGPFGAEAGRFAYLVYPACRGAAPRHRPAAVSFEDAHAAMRTTLPAFDFYANPGCRADCGGYIGSWILRGPGGVAGCSAWNNRGILGEVIESLPAPLRAARSLARAPLLRSLSWPHFPAPGEELRSWYLFDFFATDGHLARELMRYVAGEAVDNGIDYCYVIHQPHAEWLKAVRADVPRLFAPVVPYRLLVGRPYDHAHHIDRLYVDVRDL